MKYKILFIIPSLGQGGAQEMLLKVLSRFQEKLITEVISLTAIMPLKERFLDRGINISTLGMKRGCPNPITIFELSKRIKKINPDIVQTWMYHGDLLGGISSRIANPSTPIIWNIRHGKPTLTSRNLLTYATVKTCALISKSIPHRILCCAESAKQNHIKLGYDKRKMVVIPNGFDMERFSPSHKDRIEARNELGINEDKIVLGIVGRQHPVKDHQNFVAAANRLLSYGYNAHFVMIGDDVCWENRSFFSHLDHSRFSLLGRRNDIPRLMSAFDISVSSSKVEAFSNTIGESMACGIPCVVTDVGDSAYIVGDTGKIVPPMDPDAMVRAWIELIDLGPEGRSSLGARARERISTRFSIDAVVNQYESLYWETLEAYVWQKERSVPWRAS